MTRICCLTAATSGLCLAVSSDLRLIQAVKRQNVESVRVLLKQHVDVNAAQGDGTTALHWAADLDNLAIADLLIRAGARSNAANDLGATPLYLACGNRSVSMVDRLLVAGANPNAKLLNGETVLMTCARTGEPKTVKALLVHGADAKAKEPEHDQTALMWAAAQSHPEAVGMLIEFGADVRARSRIYSQTVVGEQTQRAGREELNYTVQRGGSDAACYLRRGMVTLNPPGSCWRQVRMPTIRCPMAPAPWCWQPTVGREMSRSRCSRKARIRMPWAAAILRCTPRFSGAT